MASVDSKTSIKIDELVNGTVISGYVNSSGHLILQTRGGAEIDAGFIAKPFGETWSSTTPYDPGDMVGYAGMLWKAMFANVNDPPALNTATWLRLTGDSSLDWIERDPYFSGDSLTADWDFTSKVGAPIVGFSKIAGEFETGIQSLKISCPPSSTQNFRVKDETIVRGGEVVTVTVRGRLSAPAAGATLRAQLLQNDGTGNPAPGATGVVTTNPTEGLVTPSTAFATYTFTLTAVNAKPRAVINLQASADSSGSAVFLIDRVRVTKEGVGGSGGGGTPPPVTAASLRVCQATTGQSVVNNTGTLVIFDQVTHDTGQFTYSDPASGFTTVTCKEAGYYAFQANVTWASNATGRRRLRLMRNGSAFAFVQLPPSPTGTPGNQVVGHILVTAGDQITVDVLQDSGAGLNISTGTSVTWLAIWKVGGPKGDPGLGMTDGNKGDITVTGSGTSWKVNGATFTFAVAATTWNLPHNLNKKTVRVYTTDNTDKEIHGDVIHVDANNATVQWAIPMTGTAVVSA